MKVFVAGAGGLIGSAVCARLASDGHEVTAMVRPGGRGVPLAVRRRVEIEMAAALRPDDWIPHLHGHDVVVNCVGVLQDSPNENTRGVHATGAATLFAACERLGIRRVVHFSAMGVDKAQPSPFSETKLEGDQALKARDLDWVILRPSVVLGRAVFGASALFRGLAALPWLPLMRNTGELQVVALDDVTATVAFFVDPAAPSRLELELAGPEQLSIADVVARYREWLGWPPARTYLLSDWVSSLLYRAGDAAGSLGWRPAMRSTARKEIVRGAVGDPGPWTAATGIVPMSLALQLAAQPASVQERWFAKLFFLKPVIFVILPFFWLATGVISLTTGFEIGRQLMLDAGTGPLASPGVVAGAIADILVGIAIAWRRTSRLGLYGALALSAFYVVAGTVLLPELWNEPLGPLMKIWPIMALHLVALAILDER